MASDKRHFYHDDEESGSHKKLPGVSSRSDSDRLPNDLPSSDLAKRTCVRLWDEIGRMEEDSAVMELTPSPFSTSSVSLPKKPASGENRRMTPKFPAFKRSSTKTTPFILKKVSVYEETAINSNRENIPEAVSSGQEKGLPFVISPVSVRIPARPAVISPVSVRIPARPAVISPVSVRVPARPAVISPVTVPVLLPISQPAAAALPSKPVSAFPDISFPVPETIISSPLSLPGQAAVPKLAVPSAPSGSVSASLAGISFAEIPESPSLPPASVPVTSGTVSAESFLPNTDLVSAEPAAAKDVPAARITAVNSRISLQDISREFTRDRIHNSKTRRRRFRSPLINGEIREELKDEYYWEILPAETGKVRKRSRFDGQLQGLPERSTDGIYGRISREEAWEPNLITAMLVEPVIFIGHITLLILIPFRLFFRKSEGTTPVLDEADSSLPEKTEEKKRWFRPIDILIALVCGVAIAALVIYPLVLKFGGEIYQTVRQSNVRRFSNSAAMPEETPSLIQLLLHPSEALGELHGRLLLSEPSSPSGADQNGGETDAFSAPAAEETDTVPTDAAEPSDILFDEFESP